jgi:hypothetical protein
MGTSGCLILTFASRRDTDNGSIVKLFGAKEKAMHLIEHSNPEVARYALQCVSKVSKAFKSCVACLVRLRSVSQPGRLMNESACG